MRILRNITSDRGNDRFTPSLFAPLRLNIGLKQQLEGVPGTHSALYA